MRNLMSWGSMLFFSIIAQIQTFLFCGLACGYAFGVYAYLKLMRYEFIPKELREASGQQDVRTGVYMEQWEGVYQAARVGDAREVVQQMPIVGWYFLVGFAVGAVAFVLIVNIATIYQLRRLAAGASKLVSDLGAEPLLSFSDAGSLDLVPKVVHDLAVRFGVPAPELYILPEEEGINAFIAGRRQSESVLVVTHGLRHLNEIQLRGVLAHEMAHLSSGDMVHNMRLLALELGVNSVRHTAEWMLRTGWGLLFGGSSNHRSAMTTIQWGSLLLLFGMMIWPMGLISSCAGAMAMAMNNRRRELRADRLAISVLGSPEPIAEALKRILGHTRSGKIAGAESRKLGHLMFSQASGGSGGLFGSHPAMDKRIRRVDRLWDGVPTYENNDEHAFDLSHLVDLEQVESALADLDLAKVELYRDRKAALVTIPSLLLFDPALRSLVKTLPNPATVESVETLWQCISDVDASQRFALTELAISTANQSQDASVEQMLLAIEDGLPEDAWIAWFWTQIFLDALADQRTPPRVTMKDCRGCTDELAEIFSLAVSLDSGSGSACNMRELRFQRLWMATGLDAVEYIPPDEIPRELLAASVGKLSHLPKVKLKCLINCLVELFQAQDCVSADQAVYLRYLTARWNVATPEPPFSMISRSASDAKLCFHR